MDRMDKKKMKTKYIVEKKSTALDGINRIN